MLYSEKRLRGVSLVNWANFQTVLYVIVTLLWFFFAFLVGFLTAIDIAPGEMGPLDFLARVGFLLVFGFWFVSIPIVWILGVVGAFIINIALKIVGGLALDLDNNANWD